MSNSYAQATVAPHLPSKLFSRIELDFLEANGFAHELTDEGNYYFFAEDNFNTAGDDFEVDEGLPQKQREYLQKLTEKWTVLTVFQEVLKRQTDIKEIIIKGAYTCSRMLEGEFGGYAARITATTIQDGGIDCLLDWFRANPDMPSLVTNNNLYLA